MDIFNKLKEQNETNDRIIQRTLREIELEILIKAMILMEEWQKKIFYRNLSKRASIMVAEQLEKKEKIISEIVAKKAFEMVKQHLERNYKELKSDVEKGKIELPEIKTNTFHEILKTFKTLSEYLGENEIVTLDKITDKIDNIIMKKGLELLVDGYDLIDIKDILLKYRDRYLEIAKLKIDMIIEGIELIGSSELPEKVVEKLKPFLLNDDNLIK